MNNMPTGRCPKCGRCYYGWALLKPGDHICQQCGTNLDLEISEKSAIDLLTELLKAKIAPDITQDSKYRNRN